MSTLNNSNKVTFNLQQSSTSKLFISDSFLAFEPWSKKKKYLKSLDLFLKINTFKVTDKYKSIQSTKHSKTRNNYLFLKEISNMFRMKYSHNQTHNGSFFVCLISLVMAIFLPKHEADVLCKQRVVFRLSIWYLIVLCTRQEWNVLWKTNLLMFRELIGVRSESHMNYVRTPCCRNTSLLNAELDTKRNKHCF